MNVALTILPANPSATSASSAKATNIKPKSQQNTSFSDTLNNAASKPNTVAVEEQAADADPVKFLLPGTPTNLIIKSNDSAGNQLAPDCSDILIADKTSQDDNTLLQSDQNLLVNNPALVVQALSALPNISPTATGVLASEATVAPIAAPTTSSSQQTAALPELPVHPELAQASTVPSTTSSQSNPSNGAANILNTQQNKGQAPLSTHSSNTITTIVPQTVIVSQSPKGEIAIRNEANPESDQQELDSGVIPTPVVNQQARNLSKDSTGKGHDTLADSNLLNQSKIHQDLNISTVEVIKPHTSFAQGLEAALTPATVTANITEAQQQSTPFTDVHQVADQIVEQTRLIAKPHNTEMIIKLKPEHLGELTLKVVVENGVVNASFHSNNAEVRNIIESSLPQLKQDLANSGLKVDNVSVYAGLSQFLPNHDQDRNSRQQQIKFTNKKSAEDFVEAIDGELTEGRITGITGQSGVDYRI